MDDNKKKTLIDVLCKLSQSTSYHSTTYVLEKFERDYTLADTIENAVFLLESESK